MNPREYGNPNPNAPPELSQFAFLIGTWACDVRARRDDGTYEPLRASLVGRYILDGYAIADEFRMVRRDGALVLFGATYRSYHAGRGAWVMKFHNALDSTWLDLGPEELGGVRIDDAAITFLHRVPPDGLVRVTFTGISEGRFSWRADTSPDGGGTWVEEALVMKCQRIT